MTRGRILRTIGVVLAIIVCFGPTEEMSDLDLLTTWDPKIEKVLNHSSMDEDVRVTLNGLTSLTPTQAQVLVDWDPHAYTKTWWHSILTEQIAKHPYELRHLIEYTGHPTMACHHPIELNGLTSLSMSTAQVLSQARVQSLSLNGLTMLSPKVARALITKRNYGSLYLNGISELTPELARELVYLGGLFRLRELSLLGVKEITNETIEALKPMERIELVLGLESVSPKQVELFDQIENSAVSLPRLKQLTVELMDIYIQTHRNFNGDVDIDQHLEIDRAVVNRALSLVQESHEEYDRLVANPRNRHTPRPLRISLTIPKEWNDVWSNQCTAHEALVCVQPE